MPDKRTGKKIKQAAESATLASGGATPPVVSDPTHRPPMKKKSK